MKNILIIIIATVIGYLAGAATIFFLMKKDPERAREMNPIHIQATQDATSQFNENANDPSKNPMNNTLLTTIQFDKTEHDFGTIQEGDVVHTSFVISNTGKHDLLISNCLGSCGCTVPVWPKNPIKPGKSAEIEVSFNSSAKIGEQQKTVNVFTNSEPPNTNLIIKANVKNKK